jgi:TonB family protein
MKILALIALLILPVFSLAQTPTREARGDGRQGEKDPRVVDAVLLEAVSNIDAGYRTNDDARLRQGLEQLKLFVSQQPDSNAYKASAKEALTYLTHPMEASEASLFENKPPAPQDELAQEAYKRQKHKVRNGKAVSIPKPPYPLIARLAKVEGIVVVKVIVNEEGNIIAARATAGHPLLQAAAVAGARMAKFTPTTLDGNPVKVTGMVNYNFK